MVFKLKNLLLLGLIVGIFVGCQQTTGTTKALKNKTALETAKSKGSKGGSSPIDPSQAQNEISPDNTQTTVVNIQEDSTTEISFHILGLSDPSASCSSAYLSYSSSDVSLVAAQNAVTWGGSWPNCTAVISPTENANGSAIIEITAHVGAAAVVVKSVTFESEPVNDAPTMASISSPQTTSEDNALDVAFTANDVDGNLTCTADHLQYSSDAASIVATSGAVAWSGTWPNCTGTISPVSNANGSANITFTVTDGALTASRVFAFTATAVNDAPSISDVVSQSTNEDTALNSLAVTINDVDSALVCATALSGTSSNTALLPNTNIAIGGTAPNCTVSLSPASNQNVTATVTLTVTDGLLSAQDTFVLTVNAINDAPTMASISSPQMTNQDASLGVAFTANDLDGALTCTAANLLYSSDTASIVAVSGAVSWSGTWPNCVGTITPVANAFGSSNITFLVNDGTQTATRTFALSVLHVDHAPIAVDITPPAFDQDTASIITLLYSDTDNDLATACAISSPSNVTVTTPCACNGSGICTVGVTGNFHYVGSSGFSYTVNANGATSNIANSTFSISAVDTAPVATNITPATMTAGRASTLTLSYTDAETDKATNCSLSSLSHVTETTACSCNGAGVCTVGVTGDASYSGSAGFSYTVTANSKPSNAATASFSVVQPVPTKVVFSGQPINSYVGENMSPAVYVQLQDAIGDVVNSGVSVTLALSSPPAGIALSGTLTTTTVGGVATFADLRVNAGASGLVLLATSGGLTSDLSSSFNVSLAQAVLDSIDGSSNPLTPSLTISNVGFGVLLEVVQEADASCNGGTVLSSTVSTSTTAMLPAPFLGGAAPVSLRVRSTDAAGNVTCSTTSVAYTNPNAGFYSPDSGQNKLALSQHACSVVNDSLYCWGRNNYSQLGDGTTTTSTTPKPVAGMNGGVSSISVSEGHTCVVKSGAVYCWGRNSTLQADASFASSQTTPTMYPTLTQNITALSVGGTGTSGFGCAIKSGALICWGNNSNNQVTNNTTNCTTSCTVEASPLNTGVTAVSAGSNFACAIQDAGGTTGSLYCWGGNTAGQLGDNSTTQRAAPTAVAAPSSSWTSISADPSGTSACGLNAGKVYCWGTNASGQLGLGNTTSVLVPTLVPDTANFFNSGVSAVSVNNQKACAIKDAGLYCWGLNSSGEIYSATTANVLAPLAVSTFSSGVTGIAVGYGSICAVQNSLTKCWGANTYGELGNGSIGFPSSVLSPSQSVLSGGSISSYVNGTTSSAIQSGALKVWGSNGNGQFGNGGTVGGPMPVVPTGLGSGVTYASLSTSGCFGIKDGGLYSWGTNNANGFLGNGNTSPQYTPAPLALGNSTSAVTSIVQSASVNYAYALKGGGLFYWGLNSSGQSGNATTTSPVTSPFEVFSAGSGVSDVLISSHSATGTPTTACAIKNASLWCWGNNAYGQVGDGTVTSPRTSPYEVPVGGSTNNVTAVKSSLSGAFSIFQRASTCALKNGALYCWGDNSNGQLGKGNTAADYTTAISTPISFAGTTTGVSDFNLMNVTNVTTTYPGVCAVQSGSLWCWGYNVYGLTGNGSVTSPVTSPYKTLDGASGGSVTSFTSGTSNSVPSWAIKGGALYVWGANTGGQVGNGTTSLSTNPVTTPYQTLPATLDGSSNGSVSKVIMGVGSAQSSCALKGGGLYCWGPNTSGQLGQNNTTANYTPTLVPGLETGVTDFVGLSGTLFCAIKNDALYCWGANSTGKVGNGTTANVLSPYKVFDAGVSQVSLTSGTCATVFNNIKCWGPGSSGQLGVTAFSGLSYPLAKVGNVKPVLSSLNNQNTTVDVALNNIPFTINDNDNSPTALSCASSVSVTSSNATLLPTSNIVIGGTAPNCTLSLTPFAGGIGTSSVTLTLSDTLDTVSNSFTFAVTPTSLPITATGGTISYLTSGGTLYKLHTFASVGSAAFDVTNSDGTTPVEYLMVAGGGGGAGGCSGMYAFPGGGGQVRTGNTVVTAQSYPITVGAGGVGTVQTIAGPGQSGSSSAVFSLSAAGGGAGGNSCLSGASGAGFAAGTNNGSATGGGGGAGAAGGNASGVNGPLHGGAGGIGVSSSITGTSTGYGGGGAGDGYNPSGSGGNVAVDGGGKGSPDNISWAAPSNRGGGGSAAYFAPLSNGGSGVVILRYPIGTP